MSIIQLDNVWKSVKEKTLRGFLEERGFAVSNILLKGSSTVADLQDPTVVEKAIVTLNGRCFGT